MRRQERHWSSVHCPVCLYLMCSYLSSLFLLTFSSDKKERATEGPWEKLGAGSGVIDAGRWDVRMVKIHRDAQVGGMQNLPSTQWNRH